MARKSERSILLFGMLFVFACLLLGGGWRLVAVGESDDPIPVRPYMSIRAVFSAVQTKVEESLSEVRRDFYPQRIRSLPAEDHQALKRPVSSDANGNVLASGTYMRAVYQAFVLDDGFV